jgi:hypothetical protein
MMDPLLDPDLAKFARLCYRTGFCKETICNLIGCTKSDFDRITKDCQQGDKEYILDKLEI